MNTGCVAVIFPIRTKRKQKVAFRQVCAFDGFKSPNTPLSPSGRLGPSTVAAARTASADGSAGRTYAAVIARPASSCFASAIAGTGAVFHVARNVAASRVRSAAIAGRAR